MKITAISTGYVGPVSSACFSDFGRKVVCVDTSGSQIAAFKQDEVPIYEPGLLVRTGSAGRLTSPFCGRNHAHETAPEELRGAKLTLYGNGSPAMWLM